MFAYLLCATIVATPIELPTPNNSEAQESILTEAEFTLNIAEGTDTPTETIEGEQSITANEENNTVEKKLITITNNIQPSMLAYKHWTGTYNPDAFAVFINDTEVAQGTEIKIPAANSTINVKFDYSFVNGMRKGSKTVSYKLNDDITQANITFSWKDDNKILLDNGIAITI